MVESSKPVLVAITSSAKLVLKLDTKIIDEINSNDQNFRLGRIINTSKLDEYGNYSIKFELTTPMIGNFNIGDFIIGMESNCLAMIVPYYWNEIGLPKASDIDLGYETYITNKKLRKTSLKSPNSYNNNWSIKKIDGGSENITIPLNIKLAFLALPTITLNGPFDLTSREVSSPANL